MVARNGFLPQDAEQRDKSWLDTYGMVQTLMADFPDFLPNTYDQYYLYPEYKAATWILISPVRMRSWQEGRSGYLKSVRR